MPLNDTNTRLLGLDQAVASRELGAAMAKATYAASEYTDPEGRTRHRFDPDADQRSEIATELLRKEAEHYLSFQTEFPMEVSMALQTEGVTGVSPLTTLLRAYFPDRKRLEKTLRDVDTLDARAVGQVAGNARNQYDQAVLFEALEAQYGDNIEQLRVGLRDLNTNENLRNTDKLEVELARGNADDLTRLYVQLLAEARANRDRIAL